MARIELRNTIIRLKDGFTGTAAVNEMGLMTGAVDFDIDTIAGFPDAGDEVFNGVRFTVAGETGTPVHTVTAHSGGPPTTNITFTPALVSSVSDTAVVTFLPAQIEIKIGEGNLTWTENRELEYVLDRGDLDTVRQGDQQPLELNLDFVYEFYTTTGGSFDPTPVDFLKRIGDAVNLANTAADPCEPFAVDVEIEYTPACESVDIETLLFPDFRYESLEFDLSEATISVTGKCNAVEPTATRG